jgi:hypothetical protein
VSAVVGKNPVEPGWVSFERKPSGHLDPVSVTESGSLRTLVDNLLKAGFWGEFTYSQRGADKIREALAHRMEDIHHPALAHVSMTILLPVVENDQSLWGISMAMGGQIVHGGADTRFRKPDLGQQVAGWFRAMGFENLERLGAATHPCELLLRPTWFQVPARIASEQEQARRAHLAEIERQYAERRKAADPTERRRRQTAEDLAAMTGTPEQRAAAEAVRKAKYGVPAAVKIVPTGPAPRKSEHPEDLRFFPGYGWVVGNPTGER